MIPLATSLQKETEPRGISLSFSICSTEKKLSCNDLLSQRGREYECNNDF